MIEKPIVFVLGAGASACYDFPLGRQLRHDVIDELAYGRPTHQSLETVLGFERPEIEKFRSALQYSNQYSVDAFLELRPEFLRIGKAAMGELLIRREVEGKLWRRDSLNWMQYLFDKMRAKSLDDFAKNEVSFITFNFDRSLEHFLMTSLCNSYDVVNSDACAHIFDAIPIIHLHGRLGFLPWQSKVQARQYKAKITEQSLSVCISQIKVIHEELEEERYKQFTQAKRLMNDAEKIYFLGFGFGDLNIERLALRDLNGNKAVATAHGLSGREVDSIRKKVDARISIYSNHTIESLFREMVEWD